MKTPNWKAEEFEHNRKPVNMTKVSVWEGEMGDRIEGARKGWRPEAR